MKQVTKKITTSNAPMPIGPYSQAIFTLPKKMLFISGQIPFDINSDVLVTDIRSATKLVMSYLEAILKESGMDFSCVVKTTIYLLDMKDFPIVNKIYSSYFKEIITLPARETVAVVALPKGASIEISMIAAQP